MYVGTDTYGHVRGGHGFLPGDPAGGGARLERSGAECHADAHEQASGCLGGAVRPGAHQGRGERRRHRDEAGKQRGPFRADALHGHVPADEADHRHHRRLPAERERLLAGGHTDEPGAVQDESGDRGLDRGDAGHRRGEQLGPERTQYRYGQYGEADLAGERGDRPGEAGPVRAAPALDGERADGDQQRAVHDGAGGAAAAQQREQDGDDDRRAADEDARDGGFGGALGGDDGQVEADHADGGDGGEPAPLPPGEGAQRRGGAPGDEREEQQAGDAVADGLAAGVRVVAEDAVGGEGGADECAGESGEEHPGQGAAGGSGFHEDDARDRGGPV